MGFSWKSLGRQIDKAVGGKKGWADLVSKVPVVGGAASLALTTADKVEEEARKRGVDPSTVAKEKVEAAKQAAQTAQDAAAAGRFVKTASPVLVPVGVAILVVIALIVAKD